MATMMIIVVILLVITKDRKGLKLNSPRQACHIMPSLIPSPRPPPDDKLSLVAPFCSPSAILSPSDQKMTINIFQPIVLFSAQFHKITRTEAILLHYFTISCQIDSHLLHHHHHHNGGGGHIDHIWTGAERLSHASSRGTSFALCCTAE